jgi:hypothetical protein
MSEYFVVGGRSAARSGWRAPGRLLVAALSVLLGLLIAVVAPHSLPAHADAAGKGGDYVPFATPQAVLDTRNGTGGTTGVRGAASTTTFQVLGTGSVPATGVSAVMVRVTAISATAATWLELWPDGTTRPTLTMLSVAAGENISNVATVKPGSNGKIAIYNNAGSTHELVEVQGYFTTASATTGGGFVPVTHTRLIDTRSGTGTTTGTIAAGGTRTVTITGSLVPAGTSSVYVNLIVPSATVAGYLTATPTGVAAGNGIISYVAGSTDSGATLKLSSSGQVTFTNKGTAAVNLVVILEGYFTATPTTGAGLRPIASRLFNTRTTGTPVAAGGTIDVQVAGTNGLPTRSIAGAMLNLIVTPVAAGYLRAWPVGQAEPALTMIDFNAGDWRAGAAIIKPGTDGKIRIKNGSSGTINLIVDLQGWFADPLPGVAVTQNSRVSVMQAAPATGATLGTPEYAFVDNLGRVSYGHQTDPDNFGSLQWTVTSGNEAFSGQPALGQLSDGRMQVAAQNTDSNIWSDDQTTAGTAGWNAWSGLGGSMASPPVVGKLSDGTTVLFAVDADGTLWAYAQSGTSPYWKSLGSAGLTGSLSVVGVRDGLQLVGLDSTGAVKTALYYVDGSLSAWTDLGGAGSTGTPAVVVYPGYRLRVLVHAADGTIATKYTDASGAWPATWSPVGTFVSAGAPAAILDPVLGRTVVVVRGTDNEIYDVWETAQGSDVWGSWVKSLGPDASDPSVTDPSVAPFTNSSGQSWIIVFRNANGATRVYWRSDAPVTAAASAASAAKPLAAATTFTPYTLPAAP